MRILFTGGGTGGHIYPIIAIKSAFGETAADKFDFYYLGPDSFAKENLNGIKAKFISAGKLRRYFSLLAPIDLIKILIGIIQSFVHLFIWMPDVVFSKGGYGSFPVVFAAWLYKIPIILHDSDAVPGLTNRKMVRFAKKIILSFDNAKKYFKPKYQNKIIVIGNPVRKELLGGNKEEARKLFKINSTKPVVLIVGGSQGAEKINEIVINTLSRFLEIAEIIHVTGEKNFKNIEKEAQKLPTYHIYPFLNTEQLKYAFAAADLIISRAGATFIFEIAAVGKPSILIPLPSAASDHQRENAFEFVNPLAGGQPRAIILEQENLTPNLFLTAISNLLNNPDKLRQMSEKAKIFYNPNTAELIRDEILQYDKKS